MPSVKSMFLAVVALAAVQGESAQAQTQTLQEQFDAASTAASTAKCQEAIKLFETLEHDPRVKPGSLPAAAIAVRKNICLFRLNQKGADEAALKRGMATLAKAGSSFDVDVINGWVALGNFAFNQYDYPGAVSNFQSGLAVASNDEDKLRLLAQLAKASAFDGTPQSLSYSEQALRIVSAQPQPDKGQLTSFHILHARTLLNQGRAEEAYKELKEALKLSGGLTLKTTLREVALRSDLAMAASLIGRKADARLYLAYTGAGRIKEAPFNSAKWMDSPLCGNETGLKPEDIAVVEFSINDDGRVDSAQTVYSRGNPEVAATFGKAVRDWYWDRDDVVKVPEFFRLLTRVEIRCSNQLAGGPDLRDPIYERFWTWAGPILSTFRASLPADADAQAYIAKTKTEGNHEAQIAASIWLGFQPSVSTANRIAALQDATALASTITLPQEVRNMLSIISLQAAQVDQGWNKDSLKEYVALANDPAIAKDALAADTLRMLATRRHLDIRLQEVPDLLKMVAEDDRLPENHPLRQRAFLDLAGLAAANGDQTAAENYFRKTGLTEEQCAILGGTPALKRSNVTSADYPTEALAMGFEGWVKTEFDISTDGRTVNPRSLIAYPPLIFGDAAKELAKSLKYDVSYRPGSSLACNANREGFNFRIP